MNSDIIQEQKFQKTKRFFWIKKFGDKKNRNCTCFSKMKLEREMFAKTYYERSRYKSSLVESLFL